MSRFFLLTLIFYVATSYGEEAIKQNYESNSGGGLTEITDESLSNVSGATVVNTDEFAQYYESKNEALFERAKMISSDVDLTQCYTDGKNVQGSE